MTEGRRAAAEPLETRRETVTVQIEGELDHFSAERVRAMLDALISDAHVKRLVIDLSKLTFMDSSGIGVMLGAIAIWRGAAARWPCVASARRWTGFSECPGFTRL